MTWPEEAISELSTVLLTSIVLTGGSIGERLEKDPGSVCLFCVPLAIKAVGLTGVELEVVPIARKV